MTMPSRAGAARLHSYSLLRPTPVALAIALALCSPQALLAAEAADADAEETTELEEVRVTGTRVRMVTGMDTPTPVTAVSAAELQVMSATSLTEALTQLPQFFNNQTAENFGGVNNGFFTSPGGGSANLRGIGSNRTLSLLDGRRMPAASIFGGPDINTFPDQMLRGIESVTGGASAQWGTDAVSGVVNYLLDTNFEGIRASAQYGTTDRGDGGNYKYSVSLGHALTDRMHVLFSAGHTKQNTINQTGDRDWYQSCGLIGSTAAGAGSSQSNPALIPACNLRSNRWSVDGVLNPAGTGPLGRITFDANGNATPFAGGSMTAANGSVQVGGGGEDPADVLNVLLPGQTRSNGFLYLDYDVTDNFNVYVQGMHSKQNLSRQGLVGGYGVAGFHPITIFQDNAYLPASVRQTMIANNITSVTFQRQISPFDGALGEFSNKTKTNVGSVGFKSTLAGGGFFEGWDLNGYFQYGTTDLDAEQAGGTRQDRVFLAADAVLDPATGTIRCRVQVISPGLLPDCQPLNLFGRGNASAAAIDWISGFDPGVAVTTIPWIASAQVFGQPYSYIGDEAKHRLVKLNQRVAEVTATGDVYEGWAGPITALVGANWRRESVDQRVQASQGNPAASPTFYPVMCNDPGAANGTQQCSTTFVPGTTTSILARQVATGVRPSAGVIGVRGVPAGVATNLVETQFSNVPFIRGHYDVKEAFAGTVVPLLQDQPFMRSLLLEANVRWADWAGSGQIWSWKGGLNAQITDELRLRGTYSRDMRAGNIADRFDRTGGAATVTDTFFPPGPTRPAAYGITIVSGGNPLIEPEKGDTYTVGLVYRPNWLPGFSASVDWLKVTLNDAIETLTVQQIVDGCYEQGDLDQCARITRGLDGSGNDRIIFVNQTRQNLNKMIFDGIDFELGYNTSVNLLGGGERIGVRLFGTYLMEASTTNSFGVKFDNTGSLPLQYFKKKANLSLSYSRGEFSWNLNGRYNSGGTNNLNWNVPNATTGVVTTWNVADNHTGGSVYWDTRLGYRIKTGGGDVEVFGNVTNLLDRDPPRVLGEGVGLQTGGGYDQIGRRYVMGVNLRF